VNYPKLHNQAKNKTPLQDTAVLTIEGSRTITLPPLSFPLPVYRDRPSIVPARDRVVISADQREAAQEQIALAYLARKDAEDFARGRQEDIDSAPYWPNLPPLPRTCTALVPRTARPPMVVDDGWIVYVHLRDRLYLEEKAQRRAKVLALHPDRLTKFYLGPPRKTNGRWVRFDGEGHRGHAKGAWMQREQDKYRTWLQSQRAWYASHGLTPPLRGQRADGVAPPAVTVLHQERYPTRGFNSTRYHAQQEAHA
jgi:hypothetical protein